MNTFATERYTLDAMTPDERDAFEEHFVDCRVCSVDVREAAENSVEIPQEAPKLVPPEESDPQPQPLPWRWRQRYLLPIAAALILSVAGPQMWERLTNDSERERLVPTYSFVSDARGGSEEKVVTAGAESKFVVGIPEVEGAASYRVEVRRDGRVTQGWDVSPAQIQETVSLPLSPLPPGGYELVIESVDSGGKRLEITRESFNAKPEGRQNK